MAFGFDCFELDGVTPQNIGAAGTPAFVRELPPSLAPAGGSRAFFQGSSPGVAPYASTTTLRAALVAGLTGPEFTGVNFFENASSPAPTVTLNSLGEIASLVPLPDLLLAPGVGMAVRVTFTGGAYVDVQGTVATVSTALSAGGGAGEVVGPLSCVYVERPSPNGRGNDATGIRGDAAKPFATLLAAFAAMFDGDELRIASGTFAAPTSVIPGLLASGSISGVPGQTIIDATAAEDGLCWSGHKRNAWQVEGLTFIQPTAGFYAVTADGSAAPPQTFFVDSGRGVLKFTNCVFSGPALFRYCGSVVMQHVSTTAESASPDGNTFEVVTCGKSDFLGCYFPNDVTVANSVNKADPLGPFYPLAPGRMYFDGGCTFFSPGTLIMVGQPRLEAAPGSVLPSVQGQGLTNFGSGPGFGLTVNGRVTALNFADPGMTIPDGARTLDIRGATVLEAAQFALQAGSLARCKVLAGGAQFVDGSSVLYAGLGIDAECEGASFFDLLANAVTVDDGTIRPSTFALTPVEIGVSTTVPFVLPFTLPGNNYVVNFDADNATTLPLAATSKTATGFNGIVTVAAGKLGAVVTYFGP